MLFASDATLLSRSTAAKPRDAGMLARASHQILTIAFLAYVFIGTDPFPSASIASRTEGSPLDRLFVLSLSLLALFVLLMHYRTIPSLLFRGAGLWLVVGFAVLSTAWSDYPDLTLRRSIALTCLVIVAAAVASGVRDIRSAHTVFCFSVTGVVVINLLATAAFPSLAITDIGVQGIYSQKNVAGTVAMIAVIANASWLARDHHKPGIFLLRAAMLFVSIIFLLMTKSKTSMAMTVLALVVMGAPPFIAKGGPRLALGVFCLFICGAAGILLVLAIHEFDLVSVISLVIEDMSFTGRDELWGFAWKAASERLWAGHGYGAFWDVGLAGDPLARLDPGTWLGDVEPGVINQAHNGYLELLLQLGLPVTILATIVIFGLLIKGIYYWATMKGKPGTRAGIAFLTVMPLIFLLHNLTEASLFLRGIILCNVLFVILFLLVRLHELEGGRPNTSPDQIPARFL